MDEHQAWQSRLEQVRRELPCGLPSKQTVLYVGATPFRFQMGRELFEAGCKITLLEAHKPFANHYEGHPWLEEVIHGDVRDIKKIVGDRLWDVTVWWHGPEHVRLEELETTLTGIESITSKLVILGSPWGRNLHGMVSGNPYSVHQNHLDIGDLSLLGYATRTLGKKDNPDTWCHILAWKSVAIPTVVVYTAIFGGYDDLLPVDADEMPHVCFTDKQVNVPGWDVRVVQSQNPCRDARMYKLLAHQWFPDVDISIWKDGCFDFAPGKIVEFMSCLGNNDLALFAHPSRNCVYQEAEAVIELGKAPAAQVREQMAKYRQDGYPAGNSLAATGVVIRRHTASITRLNDAWWSELMRFTMRDQLSFDYICWKNGLAYSIIPGNCWRNEFCVWHGHRSSG